MRFLAAILLAFSAVISAAQSNATPNYHAWWKDQYSNKPLNSANAKKLPLITV